MGLDEVRATWEAIGRDDPLWGVISQDHGAHGAWDRGAFFETGRADVALAYEQLAAAGVTVRAGSALDFGCGVGRLSQALAPHFDRVTGVDISAPMIEQATNYAREAGVGNCDFTVSSAARLPFADDTFDLAFTLTVLQHMPRRIACRYLAELARVLAPGGVLFAQVPGTYLVTSNSETAWKRRVMAAVPGDVRQSLHRARSGHDERALPMHSLPRWLVTALLEHHGMRVAAVLEDTAAGSSWRSFRYIAQKLTT
jgi:SAM-dependent methyltransferase